MVILAWTCPGLCQCIRSPEFSSSNRLVRSSGTRRRPHSLSRLSPGCLQALGPSALFPPGYPRAVAPDSPRKDTQTLQKVWNWNLLAASSSVLALAESMTREPV